MSLEAKMSVNPNVETKKSFPISMIIFSILTIIGMYCWYLQLSQGLQVTNLGVEMMWGIYIIFFMIFTGVAAGSLFFSSIPYVFNLKKYKPYCSIVTFVGFISSTILAALFILADIGSPLRAWLFITSGNISSPMYWDFIVVVSYIIISGLFTRQLILVNKGKKAEKSVKPMAIIAFIAGIMVIITSLVFVFQNARPTWNTAIQPFSFFISAMIAALAVIIILAVILNKVGYIEVPSQIIAAISKITFLLLALEFLIILLEVFIGLYSVGSHDYEIYQWLIKGEGAIYFWAQIGTLLLAIALLANKATNKITIVIGAISAFLAVFFIKYNLLLAELVHPLINLPGVAMHGASNELYVPTMVEIGLSLGIFSLGCLVFILGLKFLNLQNRK